ncbi:hypothetical protein PFISCL1PPCAC_23323, partial [Pristionchus fissidentatus]
IHLEYEGGYYPYSFIDRNGNISGVFLELWNIVSQEARLPLNLTKVQSKGETLTNIEENRTLTLFDSMAISPSRFNRYFTSPAFGYYELNIYEKTGELETSEFSFFTVFRWNSLLLLFVAYIFVSVFAVLLNRRTDPSEIFGFSAAARHVIYLLFLLSLTLVVFHHAAGFKGNNFAVRKNRQT